MTPARKTNTRSAQDLGSCPQLIHNMLISGAGIAALAGEYTRDPQGGGAFESALGRLHDRLPTSLTHGHHSSLRPHLPPGV